MRFPLPRLSFWTAAAVLILVLGGYGTFVRFFHGLGAVTALSDRYPWGLWIGFDVLVGVGLAASGFLIAATVHIFNLEKYEPISRPALLTAFLGYMLVMIALLFEIGRPLRVWHPLIMWNPHSVMFEVAWCITLYTTVLALEFSPIVFERFNLKVPLALIRTIYLPIVIVGVTLSTLHQSSLGTYFLIVPDKLCGLWYSPLLPVFFFLSAIAGGLAMTILQSFLSARAFGKELKHEVLCGLARVTVVVLSVYLVWKFRDLAYRGNLPLAFEYTPKSVMFWIEMGVGALLPILLIVSSGDDIKESRLFLTGLLVVMGFALNRLNISVTGMAGSETYFPKWTELAITLALVTSGFVIFSLAVKYLPIFVDDHENGRGLRPHYSPLPARSLLALWIIGIASAAAYFGSQANTPSEARAATPSARRVDISTQTLEQLPADATIPSSEDSPGPVTFSHVDHLDFQDKPDCRSCHSKSFGFRLMRKSPQGEAWHSKAACGACHDGNAAFKIKGNCENCHAEEPQEDRAAR